MVNEILDRLEKLSSRRGELERHNLNLTSKWLVAQKKLDEIQRLMDNYDKAVYWDDTAKKIQSVLNDKAY